MYIKQKNNIAKALFVLTLITVSSSSLISFNAKSL